MAQPSSPTLRQLEYFVTTARELNFRNAAAELDISQPALTAQISALEALLKIPLLERSRAGTHLTPQGRELLPQATQVLAQMRNLKEQAALISDGYQATYRLGVPPSVGPYLLPYVLPELHKRHEKLRLYVREQAHQQLVQELRNGTLDMAILPLPFNQDDLVVAPLYSEKLRYVVPADHRLSGRPTIRPNQLRGEKILTLEGQHHIRTLVKEACDRFGAHIQRDYEGTSLDTLRQMVVMGLGTAFLPALYIHSEMHKPEALYICELKGMPITRSYGLAWRAGAPSRNLYREVTADFQEIIAARLGQVVSLIKT